MDRTGAHPQVGGGRQVTWLYTKLGRALAGVGAVLAALGLAYLKGRSQARTDAENEQVRRRIDAMKTAKDVRDDVEGDSDLANRARDWVRSDDER